MPKLLKDRDYYIEDGKWVFTAHFLLKRGYCCRSGCRHCPYGFHKNRAISSAAERLTYIQEVGGSIPSSPTKE